MSSLHRGCLPSHAHRLLLRAALLPPSAALEAWEKWIGQADIMRLDAASDTLLGLLYRNLDRAGIRCTQMNRLRGIYKHQWVENQAQLASVAKLLARFNDAEISALLLRGWPLVLQSFRDFGVRPAQSLELVVCAKDRLRALDILSDARGCWPELRVSARFARADAECWRRTVPMVVREQQALTLCASEQLLLACLPDPVGTPCPPLQWLADAWTVAESQREQIDYGDLIDAARRRGVVLRLRAAFGYLLTLGAPIPITALEDLREIAVSSFQQAEFACLCAPFGRVRSALVHAVRAIPFRRASAPF